ncbi:MAG: VCBS repeat-containing protein [Acidobacteriota bacterium]
MSCSVRFALASLLVLLGPVTALAGGAAPVTAPTMPFDTGTDIRGAIQATQGAVATADIDGDGDLDVLGDVTVAGNGSLRWQENTGGGWTEHVVVGPTNTIRSVAVADIDADGDQDVAAADGLTVTWYAQAGAIWTPNLVQDATSGANDPRAVIIADINGDGLLDIASGHNGSIYWHDGLDATPMNLLVDTGAVGTESLHATDLENDGDQDLVYELAAGIESLKLAYNDGADPPVWSPFTAASGPFSVHFSDLGDIDLDGDLDAVSGSQFAAALPTGDVVWFPQPAGMSAWTRTPITAVADLCHVQVVDLNRDGALDVAVGTDGSGRLSWLHQGGTPFEWTEEILLDAGVGQAAPNAAADVDGDGDTDVVTRRDDALVLFDNLLIHSTTFAAGPQADIDSGTPLDNGVKALTTTDLNADGKLDIVSSMSDGSSPLHWHQGPLWTQHAITSSRAEIKAAATGDLEGDGDVDIVVASGTDASVAAYLSNGAATPGFTESVIDATLTAAADVQLADIDADGDLDMAAVSEGTLHLVRFYFNDGNPTPGFNTADVPRVVAAGSLGPSGLGMADIDGDGDLDAAAAGLEHLESNWLANDGMPTPIFSVNTVGTHGAAPVDIGATDIDADGDQDLLVLADAVYLAENDGGAASWTITDIGSYVSHDHDFSDVDLDGDQDVYTNVLASNLARLTFNEGPFTPPLAVFDPIQGFDAISVAAADIDHDGDPDYLAGSLSEERIVELENDLVQVDLITTDLLGADPTDVESGTLAGILAIDVVHLGRAGDRTIELDLLALNLYSAPGTPLTTGEANDLFASIDVYVDDDGTPGLDTMADTQVASQTDLTLGSGGELDIFLAGLPANPQVAATTTETLFVVANIDVEAPTQAMNTFAIEHATTADTAQDPTPVGLVIAPRPDFLSFFATVVCDLVDTDADGYGDACDNCPGIANVNAVDTDCNGDLMTESEFGELAGQQCDIDTDGVGDDCDNCPMVPNSDQENYDGDADGDACDVDADNDGVEGPFGDNEDPDDLDETTCGSPTFDDNCDDCSVQVDGTGPLPDNDPFDDGPDLDGDGECDAADGDADGDGVNGPVGEGPDTNDFDPLICTDLDFDGCDDCSQGGGQDTADDGPDFDGDGQCDDSDMDDDNDGVEDISDPDDADASVCGDSDGDGCDDCTFGVDGTGPLPDNDPLNDGLDADSDGICNIGDNCVTLSNADQANFDGDANGDVCDNDDDNDGVNDLDDPNDANPDECGDLVDGDGCDDCTGGDDDLGPNPDNIGSTDGPDFDGDGTCDVGDLDIDNDGVFGNDDVNEFDAMACEDSDSDGCDDCSIGVDGTGPLPDNTPGNDGTDTDGDGFCDVGDPDDDNDGVPDGADDDPLDPNVCQDSDGDGCDDCTVGVDGFGPLSDVDTENDGVDTDGDLQCDGTDLDDDNDGVADGVDDDPLDPNVCSDTDADGCDDCGGPLGDDFGMFPDFFPADDGTDTDSDGICDLGDTDDDNDGVLDGVDGAPLDPDLCEDTDGDGCDDCAVGTDDFGANADNDPSMDGDDNDFDGTCDLGDTDDDNDGVVDGLDFVNPPFGGPIDTSFDPDLCGDSDLDLCDDCSIGSDDLLPLPDVMPGNDGPDFDGDGLCDFGDPDADGDGVDFVIEGPGGDIDDSDPFVCLDADGDGCDDCSQGVGVDPNNDGLDTDSDGTCDLTDPDDDNDGVMDGVDSNSTDPSACEDVDGDGCDDCSVGDDGFGPNPDNDPTMDGADNDGDGTCDLTDPDDDNDTIGDGSDTDPFDPQRCTDADGDGCDDCTNGPNDFSDADVNPDPSNDGLDTDSDGSCNVGDTDDDNDGAADVADSAPLNPDLCSDLDLDGCDDCAVGSDDFGPLPDQLVNDDGLDTDMDGACDLADDDRDNDGVLDLADADPLDPNVCQDLDGDGCDDCAIGTDGFGPLPDAAPLVDGIDTDGDTVCDVGDTDDDNDGVLDGDDVDALDPTLCEDVDADGCDDCSVGFDGFGPMADARPDEDGPDRDFDGICDGNDNCLDDANPAQEDDDEDGAGDLCDNCRAVGNPDQADRNADGLGDACDPRLLGLTVSPDVVLGFTTNVDIEFEDSDGTVTEVANWIDEVVPGAETVRPVSGGGTSFALDVRSLDPGEHVLIAEARDDSGAPSLRREASFIVSPVPVPVVWVAGYHLPNPTPPALTPGSRTESVQQWAAWHEEEGGVSIIAEQADAWAPPHENAGGIGDAVDEGLATGASVVDIVAYDAGALTVRAWLDMERTRRAAAGLPPIPVRRVVFVASPHLGWDLADDFVLELLALERDGDAAAAARLANDRLLRNLTTTGAETFDRTHVTLETHAPIEFVLVAAIRPPKRDDDLLDRDSALGLVGSNVTHHVYESLLPRAPLHYLLTGDRIFFDRLQLLIEGPDGAGPLSARPARGTTVPRSSATRYVLLEGTPGGKITTAMVDEASELTVEQVSTGGELTGKFTTPSGEEIDAAEATLNENVSAQEGDAEGAGAVSKFTVTNPESGEYELETENSDPNALTFGKFTTVSDLQVAAETPEPSFLRGATVPITASLIGEDLTGWTIDSVIAIATAPDGDETLVILTDDGLGTDETAADLIYSGAFTPSFLDVGTWTVEVVVSGSNPESTPITRTSTILFDLAAQTIVSTGKFETVFEDDDDDEVVDGVVIEVEVRVTSPGSYLVSASLVDPEGTPVGESSSLLAAPLSGLYDVELQFSPEDAAAAGVSGKFNLETLTLANVTSAPVIVTSMDDAYETEKFELDDFPMNESPELGFVSPSAESPLATTDFTITWMDSDPDDDASIALFLDTDDTGADGTPIAGAEALSEDDEVDTFLLDVTGLPEGERWVYAVISDDDSEVIVYSTSPVRVGRDSDGDGLLDSYETAFGLEVMSPDSEADLDGDGLTNGFEAAFGTFPNDADSDDGGLNDRQEWLYGFSPFNGFDDPNLAGFELGDLTHTPGTSVADLVALVDNQLADVTQFPLFASDFVPATPSDDLTDPPTWLRIGDGLIDDGDIDFLIELWRGDAQVVDPALEE